MTKLRGFVMGALVVSLMGGCAGATQPDISPESEVADPDLAYWSGVAQNQIGECLDQIGTVLDYEWVPFDDDPTAFGALYIQFEKTRLTLLAREWANGDDFVVPWTDKDSAILDSVKCFD
jgi:hypothetical protein